MDHNQVVSTFDYISRSYSLAAMGQSIKVADNYNDDFNGSGIDASKKKCANNEDNYCYEGKSWTFPVQGISKNDITIIKNGKNYTNFTVSTDSAGDTIINFAQSIKYSAHPDIDSSEVGFTIKSGAKATGVQAPHDMYDYSLLGETWSDPRIFRIPNNGAGDANIEDDIYVAAMGGGYGTQFEGVGSNLTIINLEDSSCLLYTSPSPRDRG